MAVPAPPGHGPTRQQLRRNRLLVAGAAAVAAVVLGAIVVRGLPGGGEATGVATSRTTVTTQPPTSASTAVATTAPSTTAPTTPGGRRGNGASVTIAFGGDVHFEPPIRQQLLADPSTLLDPIKPTLSAADLAMVNLETAITDRGTPQAKSYTFRAPATAFTALRAAGVDVVTQANNHGMDFGTVGLADSLAAAKAAGLPVIGVGNDATEAFAPFRATVKGQRIAVIGATQVLDDNLKVAWTATDTKAGLASAYDEGHLLAAVGQARATSDTVVVYLHWGTEGQTCPNAAQPVLAKKLAAAGADVIVGSHAHRVEGAGHLGDAYVAYGLGNFVFYAHDGPGADSGVLTLTVTGRDVDAATWTPARITIGAGIPHLLAGAEAAAAQQRWAKLRGCAGLTA